MYARRQSERAGLGAARGAAGGCGRGHPRPRAGPELAGASSPLPPQPASAEPRGTGPTLREKILGKRVFPRRSSGSRGIIKSFGGLSPLCVRDGFFHTGVIPPSPTAELLDAVFKGAL